MSWRYRLGKPEERIGTDIYRPDGILVRHFDDDEEAAAAGWVDSPKKIAIDTEEDDELERLRDIARSGGIDVDLRWGVQRLQREIAKA